MSWLLVASLAVLALASYFSALVSALMLVSRSALEARLALRGREQLASWLFDHDVSTRLAVALLRTTLRLTFFALVLVEVIGERESFTWLDVVIAGVISVVVLWIFTSVLSSAVARHVTVILVAGALPVLRILSALTLPLNKGVAFVDEAVRRLTGANLREQQEAEAELLRSIEDTHREGALDEASAAMLENVVEFSSTDVGEVMTPRTDIDGIELTDDLAAIRAFIVESGHSRIPVYRENLDNIAGILYVKDLIRYLGEDASDFRLEPLLRQPIAIPETKPVSELLLDFQKSEVHLAMVIDEYGGTAGLVTIEDVLEEIVGEIHDEHEPGDEGEPEMHEIDGYHAEVDGRFHLDDLNERLGLDLPEDAEFDTIAGFVLATLGRVPTDGETFESHNARFTALETTPTHVRKVGVELLDPPNGNGERRRRIGNGG